jgi:hypothetical protein
MECFLKHVTLCRTDSAHVLLKRLLFQCGPVLYHAKMHDVAYTFLPFIGGFFS